MPTALIEVPPGLDGVAVVDTSVGDVRGLEGFYHYRQYSAVELAQHRSLEDVWYLLFFGDLPDLTASAAFAATVGQRLELPGELAPVLTALGAVGDPLAALRAGVSVLGDTVGFRPTLDSTAEQRLEEALALCAAMPALVAGAHRRRQGLGPLPARPELGLAGNYLWMLSGAEPQPAHQRALEQYLITTIDHGLNSSTFVARVIASTGADLASAVCGALGALSGPLHGGAPSRALEMLDEIADPSQARPWVERAIGQQRRIMGFGHRVYKTDDPRSVFLRGVAQDLGGPRCELAVSVERSVVEVLAELKPGRDLYTNVEFYAGVVMETVGLPRELFTATFAISRSIGWAAHVLEQAAHNRLFRPSAHYLGPPPPQPVPAR